MGELELNLKTPGASARMRGTLLNSALVGLLLAAGAVCAANAQNAQNAQNAPDASNAQTPPATPAKPAPVAAARPKTDPEDRVICRREEEIGTRLGTHNEYHTKRQWDEMARDAADYYRAQGRPAYTSPH